MSNTARLAPPMTVEEFQDWVPPAGHEGWRWHLIDGEPVGMAPARIVHGIIQNNAGKIIGNHLDKLGRCFVAQDPGVIPTARSRINQLSPDLGVSCETPPEDNTLRAPLLLVEILSPTNALATRGNIAAFKTIPSVQEILALESRSVSGTLHRRDSDGQWPNDPEELRADSMVHLRSIALSVPMAAFYGTSGLLAPPGAP